MEGYARDASAYISKMIISILILTVYCIHEFSFENSRPKKWQIE
ncbi:hypothetical protein C943_04496 [Mariniradius saccharolyticus AK6]|uniref:Uncharacterized protein n=1 Tax=Mariniradius saccharolyticus AK6 TaxID=1239962 RepID=M7XYQ0_9BACT|nr:hypothetical protein C943_04496 [Mariniradius saccharolyticus AK6]